MNDFLKVTAAIIITLILYLTLNKQDKSFSVLIAVAACCVVIAAAATFLEPVISFIKELQQIGNLDADVLQIMLKSVGIGLLAEITSMICADAGNASMGKSLQILASVVMLWLSVPVFTALIKVIEEILVAL